MEMKDIIRIAIKGESGYCCMVEAYNNKITITRASIRYKYKPLFASETNIALGDEFKEVFSIIKQMVSGCEYAPAMLLTSEDYEK